MDTEGLGASLRHGDGLTLRELVQFGENTGEEFVRSTLNLDSIEV